MKDFFNSLLARFSFEQTFWQLRRRFCRDGSAIRAVRHSQPHNNISGATTITAAMTANATAPRVVPDERKPTLVPDRNPLMRTFIGFAFYEISFALWHDCRSRTCQSRL
jgi:hypothetical protein